MKYSRFEDLPVWQAAVDLAVMIFELTVARPFRIAGDLANQVQRAGLSISNNIAEGFERGTTQELITFLYYARGSAGEVRSALCVAERIETLKDFRSQIADIKTRAEAVSRQLAAWLKSLKETDIRGDRYLTESSRRIGHQQKARDQFVTQLRQQVDAARLKREAETRDSNAEPESRP